MTQPDMFSIPKPERKTKPKPAPVKPLGMINAEVSGLISGLRAPLADIERRCEQSKAVAGILTPTQTTSVSEILCAARKMQPIAEKLIREVVYRKTDSEPEL